MRARRGGRGRAADVRQRRRLSSRIEEGRIVVESSWSRVVSRRKVGAVWRATGSCDGQLGVWGGAREDGSPRLGQQTVPTPRTLLFVSARGAVRCGRRRWAVDGEGGDDEGRDACVI